MSKKDILIDPNYTGDFFRQILPDGTIVETSDRTFIGGNALALLIPSFSNEAINYKAGHCKKINFSKS